MVNGEYYKTNHSEYFRWVTYIGVTQTSMETDFNKHKNLSTKKNPYILLNS